MSADSLRKQSKQGYHGQVILPQPVNDLSLIESVAGFIHEVVPQAYSSVLPGDLKDGILWARFDSTDYNDPDNFPQLSECESESTPPLLLVLGYSSGVQVWSVGGSGEATELLSWCQGAVKALRFLLKPAGRDPYSSKRPLVAIVDSSSPGPQFSTLSFISLKSAEVVKIIKFNSPICDVHCNRKSVVVTFSERIAVFDSGTLEDRLTITTCYPSPGNSPNPIALGPRWLAYGEKRLTTWQRSNGGCEGDGAQSYTSTVIHAAKSLGKGLRELGGSLTGNAAQTSHNTQAQPGIVSIIDIERRSSNNEEEKGNMIAHFVAHTSAVVAMAFDPSGLLLITADRHGHRFNVFRIHSHPCTAQLAAVHHLYVLHRGETTAKVQDIAVSWDSRWVAVSSVRGTTHVFPITPYGGLVTVRTHTTSHVVNKLSRFERSAGLRDGRGSPLPCETPSTPPPPRLPPYPHPSIVTPLAQLRARPDDTPLAANFGQPRAWLPGRPKSKRTCADSLYIIYSSGAFMQYDLDPKVVQGVPKEKISFDTPIELGVEAKAEWILPKPPYTSSLCPPLPLGHVLLDIPPRPLQPPDKWLSQVEIVTHTGPHRRLWMGPQFLFKSIDPLPLGGGEGEPGSESGNPLRSNPVNMPHRPFLLVEIGSGSPQMAEVDEAGGRLREDLADAMLETQHASGQAKGRLRRAEVEWQVNPLGAVQTHPTAQSHWPHPMFFEPYPPEQYKAIQQTSSPKSVGAILETLKLAEQFSDVTYQMKEGLGNELPEDVSSKEAHSETKRIFESSDVECKSTSFGDIPMEESLTPSDIGLLLECKVEPLEESEGPVPSFSEPRVTIDHPVETHFKNDDSIVSKFTSKDTVSSNKSETEEKPKLSGKKGRKKRNGNDKKSKKDQQGKIPVEETFLASLDINSIIESRSLEESEFRSSEPDIPKVDEVCIAESISDATDNLTERTREVFELLTTAEETSGEEAMGGQDIFPPVSFSQSILACGTIEVTESGPLGESETTVMCEGNVSDCETYEKPNDDIVEPLLDDKTESSFNPVDDFPELTLEECSSLTVGMSLLDKELELPPLSFNITPENYISESLETKVDQDLNGNTTLSEAVIDEVQTPSLTSEETGSSNETGEEENVANVELETEEFVPVSTKSSRSKNKRKKRDQKLEEINLSKSSEVDTSESVVIFKEEEASLEKSSNEPLPCAVAVAVEASVTVGDASSAGQNPFEDSVNINLTESAQGNEADLLHLVEETLCSREDSLKSSSLNVVSSLHSSDDVQSDQIALTDRSEVEDVSSHSGKESDDSKINKKERSRRQKRSESSDKAEIKKKSPSPATAKIETKDSESSDDAGRLIENKQPAPKIPKRKKGKKCDEGLPEVPLKEKDCSSQSTDAEGVVLIRPKEKSFESSMESSNSEGRPSRYPVSRSWSQSASSSDHQNPIEDRDSVYESCNDDGASDSLAFESSKEDFEDGSVKTTVTEPNSSNTEEKVESGDKNIQPLKKVRKQKKKKR